MWVMVQLLLMLTACGEDREVARLQSQPDALVQVEYLREVKLGNFAGVTAESISRFTPEKVEVSYKLEPVSGKYRIRVSWNAQGPKAGYWSLEKFAQRLKGTADEIYLGAGTIREGDALEYTVSELEKGGLYRFDLVAHVFEPFQNPPVSGSTVLVRLRVDLRNL